MICTSVLGQTGCQSGGVSVCACVRACVAVQACSVCMYRPLSVMRSELLSSVFVNYYHELYNCRRQYVVTTHACTCVSGNPKDHCCCQFLGMETLYE